MAAQLDSVLVVDGDERLAGDLAAGLRARKADVEVVSSAEAMLEAIDRCRPQVILLSVELPKSKGAGYLACNKLKKDAQNAAIPVILMSSTATEEDFAKHRKLATHADDYIRKPFSDDEFFRKVGNILGFEISKGDFEQLQEKVHDFLGEKADLEADIRQKSDAIAHLESVVAQLQGQLAQKRQEDASLEQLERDRLQHMQVSVREQQARLEQLQQSYKSTQDDLQSLQVRIKALEDDRRSLAEMVGELSEQKAVLEAEIELLHGQKQEVGAAVEQSQALSASLSNNIKELESAQRRLEHAAESVRRQLADAARIARESAALLDSVQV